jgi:hypothetical protein
MTADGYVRAEYRFDGQADTTGKPVPETDD